MVVVGNVVLKVHVGFSYVCVRIKLVEETLRYSTVRVTCDVPPTPLVLLEFRNYIPSTKDQGFKTCQ